MSRSPSSLRSSGPSARINKKEEGTEEYNDEVRIPWSFRPKGQIRSKAGGIERFDCVHRKLRKVRPNLMPYHTYILECADGSFYVGATNDLDRRLKQHNDSKWGAHYTKIRRPVKLKYSETFADLKTARRREVEIKGWRREKKIALIISIGNSQITR